MTNLDSLPMEMLRGRLLRCTLEGSFSVIEGRRPAAVKEIQGKRFGRNVDFDDVDSQELGRLRF